LQRLADGGPPMSGYDAFWYSYVARGRYADQLDAWLRPFPREQLLIIRSEDLSDDPDATYAQTLAFLELAPHQPEFVRHNAQRRARDAPSDLDDRLRELFVEPNRRLAERYGITW
jgi:hypothetical protein